MDTSLQQQLKDSGYKGEFNLSSLIEACGNNFFKLIFDTEIWNDISQPNTRVVEIGSTPEEAVANLWLKLNKK